jgi:predicted alpha/beta-fold hydrolase
MRVIDRISVPTLIISAADDPFVPPTPFLDSTVSGNPHITVALPEHGGHCGFVEERAGTYDGYWAEREVVDFLRLHCGTS